MNYTVITDIFGNKIDKNDDKCAFLPFILIHSVQPELLLEKANSTTNTIWKLIFHMVMHSLYINNLNPSNFGPVGHFIFYKNKLPNKISILLVNTNRDISRYPTEYIKVGKYEDLYIWKPIGEKGYESIGFLASIRKPQLKETRIINKQFLTIYRGDSNNINNIINMNEFKLLSIGKKRLTIKRTEFLKTSNVMRLYSKSKNKYLTLNKNNTIGLDNKDKKFYQKLNYTSQGELKFGEKCISVPMDDNSNDNFAYLQNCNNSTNQKWYPYRNNFISQFDQSCLNSKDPITSESCDETNENQSWITETTKTVIEDKLQETSDNWVTQKGKRVILIEPDNPWYINKTKKPKGIIKTTRTVLNQKSYRDNADYRSNFVMDTTKPHLGYGHSYASRAGRPVTCLDNCENVDPNSKIFEYFSSDGTDSKLFNFNIIISILLCLVVSLIVFRIYVNRVKK
jgi:hypothetical protein